MKRISFSIALVWILSWFIAGNYFYPSVSEAGKSRTILSSQEIKDLAREFLQEKLTWSPDRMKIRIHYDGGAISLFDANYDLDFRMPGRKNRAGRIPFSLIIKSGKGGSKRIRLYADVEVTYDILQASRPLKRNQVLEESDVEWVQISARRLLRNVVTQLDDAVGQKITRNLDEGEMISPYMLKKVPLIKRGDRIILVAEKGALRVTAPGVARQNGFINSTVKVENIQSRKIIMGTVINARTVRVEF
jgi:flagella basal body P-ring formation protein FlgA